MIMITAIMIRPHQREFQHWMISVTVRDYTIDCEAYKTCVQQISVGLTKHYLITWDSLI